MSFVIMEASEFVCMYKTESGNGQLNTGVFCTIYNNFTQMETDSVLFAYL